MPKVALVILSDGNNHESLGRIANALVTAGECLEQNDELKIIFDGGGAQGLNLAADPSHPLHRLYLQVKDRVYGACAFCARAFGVEDALKQKGVRLLADYQNHPSLRSLVAEGYVVLTF